MKKDIYEGIPILQNDKFILRAIDAERDAYDLWKVYLDEKAVPFFNSDNCNGDTFYYKTIERMRAAIEFWEDSYRHRYFVRMAVENKVKRNVIGTIELFNRRAEDYFDNCGLMRLDLRSDYETAEYIGSILHVIVPECKVLFDCDKIATKAVKAAGERILALERYGFRLSEHFLIGHDGTKYDSYFVLKL